MPCEVRDLQIEDEDEHDDEDDLAMEWLARVWFERCGLVARVPQDRMPSLRVHRTDQMEGNFGER